jgi:hypothetical protein
MILCKDWTRKFGSLTKRHELTNFTLESRALNPTSDQDEILHEVYKYVFLSHLEFGKD